MTDRQRAWGIAFALAGAIGFSIRPVLIKLAYGVPTVFDAPVSPVTLLFLRMVISLPFFVAVAWWLRAQRPAISARDGAAIGALGFVGYYAASFLDFIGLQYVGAGLGRLILFLYPTIVLLLSFFFLHARPGARHLMALALSYAGIFLVVSDRLGGGATGPLFLFGCALVFASAFCYAVYLVAGSALVQRVGSMRFTAWSMIASTVPAVVQFLVLEPFSALELPGAVWGYTAVMATACTVLPVFFVAEALKRIGANHFAVIGAVGPVSTLLAGAIGLEEPFTLVQVAGAALVIGGVLLVSLKPQQQRT